MVTFTLEVGQVLYMGNVTSPNGNVVEIDSTSPDDNLTMDGGHTNCCRVVAVITSFKRDILYRRIK